MRKPVDFKIPVAVLALIITLGLSLGGFMLYNRFMVEKPINEEMKQVAGVQRVSVHKEDKQMVVTVKLAEIPDFSVTYRLLDQIAEKHLGAGEYSLEIEDRRSQELEHFYNDIQLHLYQGIATNSFLWLDKEIGQIANSKGIQHRLRVDEDNLYLQGHKEGYYLYSVLKRGKKQVRRASRWGDSGFDQEILVGTGIGIAIFLASVGVNVIPLFFPGLLGAFISFPDAGQWQFQKRRRWYRCL